MNTFEIQIIERLTRVEEKIDSDLAHKALSNERWIDHEGRLRVVEKRSSHFTGVSAAIIFLVSVFGAVFANAFVI